MTSQPSSTEMWKLAIELRDRFEAMKVSIRIDFEDSSVTFEVPAPNEDDDE